MTAKKAASVKKSAKKSATGRPFKAGTDTRRGRGPAKGAPNAGRPPDEFKALCQSLASREGTVEAVTAILADPTHGQFMAALKWATEQGYGKPAQPVVGDPAHPIEHLHRGTVTWGGVEIPL